ncbi:MAG: hypothetical protein ACREBG_28710 [Pyrinomonadaceae bacterium]
MKKELGKFGGIALALLLGISAISSLGQQKQAASERDLKIERERIMQEGGPPVPPPGADFVFYASEMSFGGRLVKDAPYSAEAITEMTQTLSDGNRIVNKSTAMLYRDSEGRTRREQTLRAIGPFANGGDPPQTIFISDPVAAVSYMLDPRTRIARAMPPMRFKFEKKLPPPEGGKAGEVQEGPVAFRFEIEADPAMSKRVTEAGVAIGLAETRNKNARTESLGKQNIGGVEAEGTRTTVTIPAGDIGNERPIEILSERWYSPELQTVVMTRHIDPRFGENTYRLTNIDRSEPARSLFEVPQDYTLKKAPPMEPMRLKKPIPD